MSISPVAVAKKEATTDALYNQMYAELRRYRDYELTVATWFTSILLALLGGVIVGKLYLREGLADAEPLRAFIAAVPIFIGLFGAWSIGYSMRRYLKLRNWVSANLEPQEPKFTMKTSCCQVRPGVLMCIILISIGTLAGLLLAWPMVLDWMKPAV